MLFTVPGAEMVSNFHWTSLRFLKIVCSLTIQYPTAAKSEISFNLSENGDHQNSTTDRDYNREFNTESNVNHGVTVQNRVQV